MYIVVTGNPISGTSYHGMFVTAQDAAEWAEASLGAEDWWVVEVSEVETNDAEHVSDFDREHINEIMAGRGGFDWFTCHVLRLLVKCDPYNRERIRMIYPDIVKLFQEWKDGKYAKTS